METRAIVGRCHRAAHSLTLLVFFAVCPTVAFAGGSATIQASGGGNASGASNEITIEWAEENTRLNPTQQGSGYIIVRGTDGYMVTDRGGRPMVIDMAQMGQMAQSMGNRGQMAPGPGAMKEPPEIEATGQTETVAGVQGEVHRVTWRHDSGQTRQTTAVLSDDPLAVDLTKAFQRLVEGMGTTQANALNDAVIRRGYGVLRFGDDFEVTGLSADTPAAARFELPAEPMDMQEMRNRGQ